jgi:CDP-diacylglycerol--glycerol-3-phosphate 3-phosphatidyltransferase
MEEQEKENIYNVPNFLTLCRVLISLALIYFVFAGFSIKTIVITFIIAMITDALDGQIARRFKMTTEFGRKFDVMADRILMLSAISALLIKFATTGIFTKIHFLMLALIMLREIITLPFAVYGMVKKKAFPPTRFLGKLTTFLQAIVFPMILLNAYYGAFEDIVLGCAIVNSVASLGAAYYYIGDVLNNKSQEIKHKVNKII